MFNSIKNIFKSSIDVSEDANSNYELTLLCGIMIEAAHTDGEVTKEEIIKIKKTLKTIFSDNSDNVDNINNILNKCLEDINESKSLHSFTSKINKLYNEEKKLMLIEKLWEIVLSDGKVHDFESNLIRRLAGLLYISDFNCGKARKKAVASFNDEIMEK